MKYKNPLYIFAKAQASAFTGGIIDYLVMIGCTEFLHIHYTISIAIGGIVGAIVNFSINRYWTYQARQSSVGNQALKFIFVLAGSITLKSSGTFLLTTFLNLDYKISRIITDIFVSFGFNFLLQKYWVFKKDLDTVLVKA
jgi:putative flippase GtrA